MPYGTTVEGTLEIKLRLPQCGAIGFTFFLSNECGISVMMKTYCMCENVFVYVRVCLCNSAQMCVDSTTLCEATCFRFFHASSSSAVSL